jgi:hypothetical protein
MEEEMAPRRIRAEGLSPAAVVDRGRNELAGNKAEYCARSLLN